MQVIIVAFTASFKIQKSGLRLDRDSRTTIKMIGKKHISVIWSINPIMDEHDYKNVVITVALKVLF